MKNQFVWLNAKIEHSSSYFQFVSDKSKDTLTQTNEGTNRKIIFIGRVKFEWLNGIYTAYKHFITSTEIGPETALAMSYGEERICWKLCDRFLQKANAKGKNALCYVFCYNKPLKRKENKNYVWEVCQQMFSLVFFLSLFSFPSYSLSIYPSVFLSPRVLKDFCCIPSWNQSRWRSVNSNISKNKNKKYKMATKINSRTK